MVLFVGLLVLGVFCVTVSWCDVVSVCVGLCLVLDSFGEMFMWGIGDVCVSFVMLSVFVVWVGVVCLFRFGGMVLFCGMIMFRGSVLLVIVYAM